MYTGMDTRTAEDYKQYESKQHLPEDLSEKTVRCVFSFALFCIMFILRSFLCD